MLRTEASDVENFERVQMYISDFLTTRDVLVERLMELNDMFLYPVELDYVTSCQLADILLANVRKYLELKRFYDNFCEPSTCLLAATA
jgi:hypothetical protein